MAKTGAFPIKDLNLDLRNFRTIPQKNEPSALRAMISIAPGRFWALTESLLDTGYLPTENIIVLRDKKGVLNVREGNRRVAALKLILGYVAVKDLAIPEKIKEKIDQVSSDWKKQNGSVFCAVYESKEEALVDKIVTLAHGKGAKAARDNWTSVARARHNRDKNGASESGLDLLEKYLKHGKNLTAAERELWSGDYPLTVLDEVIGKIAPRLGVSNSRDLADQYPGKFREELDEILKAIGTEVITFERIRDKLADFAAPYGIPPLAQSGNSSDKKEEAPPVSPQSGSTPATGGKGGSGGKAPSNWVTAAEAKNYSGADRVKLMLLEMSKINPQKNANILCPAIRVVCELALYDKLQKSGNMKIMLAESKANITAQNAKRAAANKPLMPTIPNWTPSFGEMLSYLLDPKRGLIADPQQAKALGLVVRGNASFMDNLDNFVHNVSYHPKSSDPEELWRQFGRLLFGVLHGIK